ncbi:MAG: M28 family peptidase, partial [Sphingopyxis sp.]
MIRTTLLAALLLTAATPASAGEEPPAADPARLKADVEKLVSFGTRHTLSSATDPKRGIGAARNWGAAEFARISKACGGCLTVDRISDRFEGPRAPDGVIVEDVLAIQKGSDPDRVIMIAGHIDSRVTDVMNITADAPGANDDGSGTALVLETARLLSKQKHRATIVYALLSGEEQGLWGGKLLARHAKDKGWQVVAMLNNDIVGNTRGTDGTVVDNRVRVFSEGIRASEDLAAQLARRGIGGEDDGPSRALAKAAVRAATRNPAIGLEVVAVRRPDRFRRGGDHSPSLDLGYPAIRFTVGIENYDAQHQDLRTENGRIYGDTVDRMDFPYLARVTALNAALIAELADAPAAPAQVGVAGAGGAHTTVRGAPGDGA